MDTSTPECNPIPLIDTGLILFVVYCNFLICLSYKKKVLISALFNIFIK